MKEFFEYLDEVELQEGPAYRKRYTSSSGNVRLNTSASRKGVGASVSLRSSNSSGLGWNYNTKSGKMTIALRGSGLRWDFGGKGRGKTGMTQKEISKRAAEKRIEREQGKEQRKKDRERERYKKDISKTNEALNRAFFESQSSIAGQILKKWESFPNMEKREQILDDVSAAVKEGGLSPIKNQLSSLRDLYGKIPKTPFTVTTKASKDIFAAGHERDAYYDLKEWAKDQFELQINDVDKKRSDGREGRKRSEISVTLQFSPTEYWSYLQDELYTSALLYIMLEVTEKTNSQGMDVREWYDKNKNTPEGKVISDLSLGKLPLSYMKTKVGDPIEGYKPRPESITSELLELVHLFTGSMYTPSDVSPETPEGKLTFDDVYNSLENAENELLRYQGMVKSLLKSSNEEHNKDGLQIDLKRINKSLKFVRTDMSLIRGNKGDEQSLSFEVLGLKVGGIDLLGRKQRAIRTYIKKLEKYRPENLKLSISSRSSVSVEKQEEKQRISAEKQAEKQRVDAEKQAEKQRVDAEKQAEKQRVDAEKERVRQKENQEKEVSKTQLNSEIQKTQETLSVLINKISANKSSDDDKKSSKRFRGYERRGLLKGLQSLQKQLNQMERKLNSVPLDSLGKSKEIDKAKKVLEKINKKITPQYLNKMKNRGSLGIVGTTIFTAISSFLVVLSAGSILPTGVAAVSLVGGWLGAVASPFVKKIKRSKSIDSAELNRMMKEMFEEIGLEFLREEAEKYSPQKHEWGTDASNKYARDMTPGQSSDKKEKKKEQKEMRSFFEHLDVLDEAEYQGKEVPLNKPMKGDVKKSKVYVKDPKTGNVKKVNFGDKKMSIKKDQPGRKKSYCARSAGIEGGGKDKTKANYWSRKAWDC